MKDVLNLVRYSGIALRVAIEEIKHGSNGNTGIYFWTDSICPPRKINQNFKRKRNPRAGIQRGIMQQTNLRNNGGVGFTHSLFAPSFLSTYAPVLKHFF